MKIVLNQSHGGYRLSARAVELLGMTKQGAENLPRHNDSLVKVVRRLGNNAGEAGSRPVLKDWPDGAPYLVKEYDGWEQAQMDWVTFIKELVAKHEESVPVEELIKFLPEEPTEIITDPVR